MQVAATLDERIAAMGAHAVHGARQDAYAAAGLADLVAGLHQIADLGYVGVERIDLVPCKQPPKQDLSEHDAAFNRQFSSIRAASEHANARLKTWRMLSEEGGRYHAPLSLPVDSAGCPDPSRGSSSGPPSSHCVPAGGSS